MLEIAGNIVDLVKRQIFKGQLRVSGGRIESIKEVSSAPNIYIVPGLVDAHVHIESSMLPPAEFARLAVVHGTVATVSDPHEIANVLGVPGVEFMIQSGKRVPFKFYFGAPSCVPATEFETAGAVLGVKEVEDLLSRSEVKYLSEMMNFPAVLLKDPVVMGKIAAAKRLGKPIDGHAPGLSGPTAAAYASAGISTDHECVSSVEARDKIAAGMKILIREGSAAKNFAALVNLFAEFPKELMFCSDDLHPNDLLAGHIDRLVRRAIEYGFDIFDVLSAASLNPTRHYGLDVGQLQPGDPADFLIVDDLKLFGVLSTFINGQEVARHGESLIARSKERAINQFNRETVCAEDFALRAEGSKVRAIQAIDGQLLTTTTIEATAKERGFAVADASRDLLKIAVVNRYAPAAPAVAFVKGFGLKTGALASTVAHDSHNIIAVGTDDQSLAKAVNAVIEVNGGIAAVGDSIKSVLALPIAGLMSLDDGYLVAHAYEKIDELAKSLGSTLRAPFMTLSFLALPVIPQLKISDLGLFSSDELDFVPVFID